MGLVTFPDDDQIFRRNALFCLAQLGSELGPERLQRSLRRLHPRCVVRRQEPMASFGLPSDETWYVYRDGRLESGNSVSWWDGNGTARMLLASDGEFLEGNDALLLLFGDNLAGLKSLTTRRFWEPSISGEGPSLIELVDQDGSVHSTALLAGADGEIEVEFRVSPDERNGSGRYMLVARRVDTQHEA